MKNIIFYSTPTMKISIENEKLFRVIDPIMTKVLTFILFFKLFFFITKLLQKLVQNNIYLIKNYRFTMAVIGTFT
jgi:hypothetical protein